MDIFEHFHERTKSEQRKILRFAHDTLGVSINNLVYQTGLDWGTISAMLEKTTHVVIKSDKIKCPNPGCDEWLLTPACTVKDDNIKREITYCWHCLTPLYVYYLPKGVVGIEPIPEVRRVDNKKLVIGTVGVNVTTDIYARETKSGTWEVRVGVALFGSVNFREMIGACPFDPQYRDNYCKGEGANLDQALEVLQVDVQSMLPKE